VHTLRGGRSGRGHYIARQVKGRSATSQSSRAVAGARESHAGHEFHFLWAARRVVRLLDPKADLRRVKIEGVAPIDAAASDNAAFLAVDVTEYFGGDEFATARETVISQLKYSTRHPKREWTVGRLCARGASGRSLLGALADAYAGFQKHADGRDLAGKLRIQLVSNQPLAKSAERFWQQVRDHLAAERPSTIEALRRHLDTTMRAHLDRCMEVAELRPVEQMDFLRCLDFAGCGASALEFQQLGLAADLTASFPGRPSEAADRLLNVVRRAALPAAHDEPAIGLHELLTNFPVTSKDRLFPCPSLLETPPDAVSTEDARRLAKEVQRAADRRLLVHGEAGTGKSTTLDRLAAFLPAGSVVLTYDCFGRGEYLDLGRARHVESRFWLQLSNELAVHCGSPFLVEPPHDRHELRRAFEQRLIAAANIIGASGGLLVLAVDAADNAVIAARADHEAAFIPALWSLRVPNAARLVVSARTGRRAMVDAPPSISEFELSGFDVTASAAHLRRKYPGASESECDEFHRKTNGNPRVQAYVLATPRSLADALRVAEKTPDGIFQELLDDATKHWIYPERARSHLASLVALARPVPIGVLAEACGVTRAEVESFCGALKPGLLIKGSTVTFRDEPFETFLRQQITPEEWRATDTALATHFLGRAAHDPYAARAVAEHLYRSKDGLRLVHLAVEGPEPRVISDEVERLIVLRRRIALALQWARGVEVAKLLLLAADAARAHGALGALVTARPDLAALFANREELEKLYLDGQTEPWLAPAFWRLGAAYSRYPGLREAALEAMRRGEGWMLRWIKRDAANRERWRLDAADIANECLAIYSLAGPDAAIKELMRWRPRHRREEVLQRLVPAVATRVQPEDWQRIAALRLPLRVWVILLGAAIEAGNRPPQTLLRTTLLGLQYAGRKQRRIRASSSSYIVSMCEVAAEMRINRRQIVEVLKHHGPFLPRHAPHDSHDTSSWKDPIRAALLHAGLTNRSVDLRSLLRGSTKTPAEKQKLEAERKRVAENLGSYFNVLRIRTDALLRRARWKKWQEQWFAEVAMWEGKTTQRWFKGEWAFIQWAEIVSSIVLLSTRDFTSLLERIVDLAPKVTPESELTFWPEVSAKLLRYRRYRGLGWRLLERAANNALSRPMPGGQRWETLLNCAAIASEHDVALARDYYKRAMDAAVATQDEAVNEIGFHNRVAISVAPHISPQARRTLAARLGRTTESHDSLVSESRNIPWALTLNAMTTLDLASGLAWTGRWDDEGILDLADSIADVAVAAVKSKQIRPVHGLALLRVLREHDDLAPSFVELLNAQRQQGVSGRTALAEMLATISLWIRRDVLPQRRDPVAKLIISWAEEHGYNHSGGIEELRELHRFVAALPEAGGILRAADEPYRSGSAVKSRPPRGSTRKRLTSAWASDDDAQIKACLSEEAANTPESQRRSFLDFVTTLEFKPLCAAERIRAVSDCLNQWVGSPAVTTWGKEALPSFLDRIMPAVLHYEYASYQVRQNLIRLIKSTGAPVEDTLRNALQRHVQLLSYRQALAFAETVLEPLGASEEHQTLEWSLARMEKLLSAESLPKRPALNAPDASTHSEALAHFLWAQCGHPDRPTRWRVLHAAREIARRDEAVLAALFICSRRMDDAGFRSPGLEFFWMSARCSLLLLVRYFAAANPAALIPHFATICGIANDLSFPHVLVRELARNSALAVIDRFPDVATENMREQLRLKNQPRACYRERGHSRPSAADEKPEQRERRFAFDLMDTVPYWFTPAARVFGISGEEFSRRAEIWICDNWGQTKDDWWTDPRELRQRGHWSRSSHRHGQLPEYEIHRQYLEFHAMCCVMGELVETTPVLYDTYEDATCPFRQWLRYELSASDEAPQWLADLRDPTPFSSKFWGVFPPLETWRRERPSTDYDTALECVGDPNFMVTNGDVVVSSYDRRESISVDSFLVSPESALALVRAMQSSHSTGDFALPRCDNEHEIVEEGFELRSFLQPQSGDIAFQKHDRLRRETHPCRLRDATDFASRSGAAIDAAGRQIVSRDGKIIARLQQWSDQVGDEEYPSNSGSTGRHVLVRTDALFRYLSARGLDLIVEVVISRNVERNYRQKDDEYDLGTTRLYVFRANGQCETVAEGGTDRAASRKRTRPRAQQ
jgi:hypothetical protein